MVHLNGNASNIGHSGVSLPRILYIYPFLSHGFYFIIVVNVYVNSVEEWQLRGSLPPCLKSFKTANKRLEAVSIEFDFQRSRIQF